MILKLIISAFFVVSFTFNAKIIWDWLTRDKDRDPARQLLEIAEIKTHLESITEKLGTVSGKLDGLTIVVKGNSDPTKSLVFRIMKIEEYIKNIKCTGETSA